MNGLLLNIARKINEYGRGGNFILGIDVIIKKDLLIKKNWIYRYLRIKVDNLKIL